VFVQPQLVIIAEFQSVPGEVSAWITQDGQTLFLAAKRALQQLNNCWRQRRNDFKI